MNLRLLGLPSLDRDRRILRRLGICVHAGDVLSHASDSGRSAIACSESLTDADTVHLISWTST